jgi:hypothetical protein
VRLRPTCAGTQRTDASTGRSRTVAEEQIVVLRGGARDGDTTSVDGGVRRILATSDAPGMVDVYEDTGELVAVRGNSARGVVFALVGQEPAGDLAPEVLHSPPASSS